jgi:predicted metal-dependent HD superfamily phosphohydrolase
MLEPTEDDRAFLSVRWRELSAPYAAGDEVASRWLARLSDFYAGPGRFYHNLRHVAEVLRLLEASREHARAFAEVCFAAWFHDAVYDTLRGDNEELSAELAAEALAELRAPAETAGAVRSLILATKRHEAGSASPDAPLFLDADLSILGAPAELYLQYSAAIRREYAWVPEETYRRERKRILQGFLRRERLYFTDPMRERFETRARRNVGDEIESL